MSQREVLCTMIKGEWEPLEVIKKICCTWEPPIVFTKREIGTEPCSPAGKILGGPANSTLTTYQAGKETQNPDQAPPTGMLEFEPWKIKFGWLCSDSEPTSWAEQTQTSGNPEIH